MNAEKAMLAASEVVKRYIELDGEFSINIDELTRNEILQTWHTADATLFFRAMQEMKSELISYVYPSFTASDEFSQLMLQQTL